MSQAEAGLDKDGADFGITSFVDESSQQKVHIRETATEAAKATSPSAGPSFSKQVPTVSPRPREPASAQGKEKPASKSERRGTKGSRKKKKKSCGGSKIAKTTPQPLSPGENI